MKQIHVAVLSQCYVAAQRHVEAHGAERAVPRAGGELLHPRGAARALRRQALRHLRIGYPHTLHTAGRGISPLISYNLCRTSLTVVLYAYHSLLRRRALVYSLYDYFLHWLGNHTRRRLQSLVFALQVEQYANKTHHYADVFTEQTLAPLGELAYVRLDENTAEKVRLSNTYILVFVALTDAARNVGSVV